MHGAICVVLEIGFIGVITTLQLFLNTVSNLAMEHVVERSRVRLPAGALPG